MKGGVTAVVWSALSIYAWCGPAGSEFIEEPGVREFTGALLVRPVQPDYAAIFDGAPRAVVSASRSFAFVAQRGKPVLPQLCIYQVPVPRGWHENSYSRYLLSTGHVEFAEPNWRLFAAKRPNDIKYPYRSSVDPGQWYHTTIRSELAWNIAKVGEKIGIVDTGVDTAHADLAPNLVPGYHVVNGVGLTQGSGGDVTDVAGHGTLVAGVAAGRGNNSVGIAGMAWTVPLCPIRATDNPDTSALLGDLLAGVTWAVDNGCRVVNVSYELAVASSIELTGQYALSHNPNSVLIWSAGNSNASLGTAYDYPSVIIVGATDESDAKWINSNFGIALDVFAPGKSILSTARGGGYLYTSGTSMAAPLVTAMVSLMYNTNPHMSSGLALRGVFHGCKDLGSPGDDSFWGFGRIDAYESVKRIVTYNFQSLPLPAGLQFSTVSSINNLAHAVGYATGSGSSGWPRALLWMNGGVQLLPALFGYTDAIAYSINDSNKIVGTCRQMNTVSTFRPVMWTGGSSVAQLSNPFSSSGEARTVNDSGQVAGFYYDGSGREQGMVWTGANGGAPALQLLPLAGCIRSIPNCINDAGDVVGVSMTATNAYATYWPHPNYSPVQLASTAPNSSAWSITSGGAITGYAEVGGVRRGAVMYPDGSFSTLVDLDGTSNSTAYSSSQAGQTSGVVDLGLPSESPSMWSNSYMYNLKDLSDPSSQIGLTPKSGQQLNINGFVVGRADYYGNNSAYIGGPTIVLGQTSINVSSSILLEDFLGGASMRPVTFQLKSGNTIVDTIPNVTPDIDGVYRFQCLANGTFDVYISADNFLRKKLANRTFSSTGVSPPLSVSLINGDIDGNNVVDRSDYRAILRRIAATELGGSVGIPPTTVDLNGDGVVNMNDAKIVAKNLNKQGD
jgi:uncharacterized membrane protein